jgi:hypothetical protein
MLCLKTVIAHLPLIRAYLHLLSVVFVITTKAAALRSPFAIFFKPFHHFIKVVPDELFAVTVMRHSRFSAVDNKSSIRFQYLTQFFFRQ